jgi:pimeloyl-ACP methyl ester carboxylesterase
MTPMKLFKDCLKGPWQTAGRETKYKVKVEGDTTYLFLSGSSSDINWRDNFSFPAVPYKKQPVPWRAHGGFVRAWKSARDQILSDIKTDKVYIAGYSYGAAIAVLAHEDLVFRGLCPRTFAFGGPRVLWLPRSTIRDRFQDLTRYSVQGDIVTLVPPWAWGYRHVGGLDKLGPWRLPCVKSHLQETYRKYL